jgi:hypothetical protein
LNKRFVAKLVALLALYSTISQGTLSFMSERLLLAWYIHKPITHTAIDDLESFLWVLFWALVHILYGFGTTKNMALKKQAEWLSSRYIPEIFMRKYTIEDSGWEDAVFEDLLREWLAISQKASLVVKEHWRRSGHEVDFQQGAFDWLEEHCRTVYMEYIQAGYKHLESIRRYPDWKAVLEAPKT